MSEPKRQASDPKRFKVWITQYALTSGVFTVDAESTQWDDVVASVRSGSQPSRLYHNRDWHRTREAAVARVEEMRKAAIAATKRKLDKLTKMEIEVPK